jgi:hypothetical protein
MRLLSIDPGNTESAFTVVDEACRPLRIGKLSNEDLLSTLVDLAEDGLDEARIEMVASYGMAVGADVFETCVWIGRFEQTLLYTLGVPTERQVRLPVKLHHCHDSKAKDSNIIQALVDRFARGQKNRGKGTKGSPGWFHGFADDIWQAYALAVYAVDQKVPPF